jgi:hypothetical protein
MKRYLFGMLKNPDFNIFLQNQMLRDERTKAYKARSPMNVRFGSIKTKRFVEIKKINK